MKFRDEYRSMCMAEALDMMSREDETGKGRRRDRWARRKAKRTSKWEG